MNEKSIEKNDGKVAVITGASSGIGKATAEYLAKRGFKVFGLARREIKSDYINGVLCDVTDGARVSRVLSDIFAENGRIDCFINNAGMGISGAVEQITQAESDKLYNLNFRAVAECSRLVLPYLKQSKGVLINISSIAAIIPIPFQTAYSASKAAINSFTQALRLEVKPFGVRVAAIMPGDTKTGFTDARKKIGNETVNESANQISDKIGDKNTENRKTVDIGCNNCDDYSARLNRSVEKMEKDERGGKSPESVAKVVYKTINKKNPPALKAVGFSYKLVAFLSKILPNRFMLYIVSKLYG